MAKVKELIIDITHELVSDHNETVRTDMFFNSRRIYTDITNLPPCRVGNFDRVKPYHIIERKRVNSFNDTELLEWFETNNRPLLETITSKYF